MGTFFGRRELSCPGWAGLRPPSPHASLSFRSEGSGLGKGHRQQQGQQLTTGTHRLFPESFTVVWVCIHQEFQLEKLKQFLKFVFQGQVWANWNSHFPQKVLAKPSLTVHAPLQRARPGAQHRDSGSPVHSAVLFPAVPPGAIPGGLSIGPPAKSSIDDSYGRYDLIQSSESPATPPVAVPHSWSRAKSDSDKISNGSSINWPPGKKECAHFPVPADQDTPSLRERLGPGEARIQAQNPGNLNRIALAFSLEIHSSDKLWVWLASQGFLRPSVQWKERREGERAGRAGKESGEGALCPVRSEYVWVLSSRLDTILVFSMVAIIPSLFRRIDDLLKKV